jgi:hypothetical protein
VKGTERYLGSESYGKASDEPMIDDLNNFGPATTLPELEPKPPLKNSGLNTPSAIRIAPNTDPANAAKKPERRIGTGSGFNAEYEKNGAGTNLGFMSPAALARKVSTDPAGSSGDGKKAIQRGFDEKRLRDGARLHYGKVLESGLRSVAGRAAYTTSGGQNFSPELGPANHNIWQVIRERYNAKRGTFLN